MWSSRMRMSRPETSMATVFWTWRRLMPMWWSDTTTDACTIGCSERAVLGDEDLVDLVGPSAIRSRALSGTCPRGDGHPRRRRRPTPGSRGRPRAIRGRGRISRSRRCRFTSQPASHLLDAVDCDQTRRLDVDVRSPAHRRQRRKKRERARCCYPVNTGVLRGPDANQR